MPALESSMPRFLLSQPPPSNRQPPWRSEHPASAPPRWRTTVRGQWHPTPGELPREGQHCNSNIRNGRIRPKSCCATQSRQSATLPRVGLNAFRHGARLRGRRPRSNGSRVTIEAVTTCRDVPELRMSCDGPMLSYAETSQGRRIVFMWVCIGAVMASARVDGCRPGVRAERIGQRVAHAHHTEHAKRIASDLRMCVDPNCTQLAGRALQNPRRRIGRRKLNNFERGKDVLTLANANQGNAERPCSYSSGPCLICQPRSD